LCETAAWRSSLRQLPNLTSTAKSRPIAKPRASP
jgi:hypothetical protein